MKLIVYFFKAIYVIRKKSIKQKNRYLIAEYKFLYPDRITFPKQFYAHPLPVFNFDQSKSKLVIQSNVSLRGRINFSFMKNGLIEIGANTFFNNDCSINCLHQIKIGENCLFGEGVKLYDHNHIYKNKNQLIKDQDYTTAPIAIGNNCWIGSNVTILKGVSIGDNVVVGANCLVFKDVPANSVLVADISNQAVKSKSL